MRRSNRFSAKCSHKDLFIRVEKRGDVRKVKKNTLTFENGFKILELYFSVGIFAFMRLKPLHISLLLGYLILFWNLGPSLHRAEIFGLHFHSCCSSKGSFCCHDQGDDGHWHRHEDDHEFHSHLPCCNHERPSDCRLDIESFHSHHDCSLCDFFDNFNLVVESFDFEIANASVNFKISLPLTGWPGDPFCATARGPPAA